MKAFSFKTRGDKIKAGLGATASVLVFTGTAAAVLNPAVAVLAGGYAAISTFIGRKKKASAPAGLEPLSEFSPVAMQAASISEALGRPEAPKIYVLDTEKIKLPGVPEKMRDKILSSIFGAMVGANSIITTQKAIDTYTNPEMEFILSHEIGHLQTDEKSAGTRAKQFIGKMTTMTVLLGIFTAGAFLGPLGIPVAAGIGGLVAAGVAANALNKYTSRVAERRADRNALYLTRDLSTAEDVMKKLHDEKEQSRRHIWGENLFRTHDCFHKRMKNLQKSFNMVSEYPLHGMEPPASPEPKKPRKFDL